MKPIEKWGIKVWIGTMVFKDIFLKKACCRVQKRYEPLLPAFSNYIEAAVAIGNPDVENLEPHELGDAHCTFIHQEEHHSVPYSESCLWCRRNDCGNLLRCKRFLFQLGLADFP